MKVSIQVNGNEWRFRPVHASSIEHLPGARIFGADAVMERDAAAVLMQRLKGNEVDVKPTGLVGIAPGVLPENISKALRDYQTEGSRRVAVQLLQEGGALLADDMGLGKTLQTIAVWFRLRCPGPLLIACPASVRRTWLKEFEKWVPDVKVLLADTGAKLAKATQANKVVITSYTLAASKLPNGFVPQMLVFDEAHLLRGRRAQRSKELFDLSRSSQFRLALSGTPQWGRPRDWWMLLKVLFGYRFGTADQFDYAYCGASINQWGGKDNKGATRVDELKLRIDHIMLRRTKEEVAPELPKLTRVVKMVKATPEAKRASEAAATGALGIHDALAATLVAKMDTTVDAMVEAGKSLVFTWQKAHVYELQRQASEAGIECETITGDDSHAERAAAVERAVRSGRSIIATIDSTGTGVDGLQSVASTCIFHALDYTPIKLAQAEARLHRIGAEQPVTIVYVLMEDTLDESIMETVVEKLDQWTDIMGQDATSGIGSTIYAAGGKTEEQALAAIMEAFRDEN